MIQKTTEKSALLQSGICSSDSSIKLGAGNTIINLPFWKNLTGEDEILSDSVAMTVGNITTGKDIACVHLRGRAWSANDLASILAGDNAMTAIGNKTADYWQKQIQKVLINSLAGAFASAGVAEKLVNNISTKSGAEAVISADAMLDTMAKLGDKSDELTGIMMSSATMFKLLKQDLIDYIPASEGKSALATYMGKRVIVDDSLAGADGVESIYFFGNGAVAFNEGTDVINVETDRDTLAGDDLLITRRQFTMHPRGIKWIGEPTGVTPSNAELATGTNWSLVEEPKNVAITKLICKLA